MGGNGRTGLLRRTHVINRAGSHRPPRRADTLLLEKGAVRRRQITETLVADLRRNQGLLLAGAIAYNTLLSLVPLFALLLVALSRIVDAGLLIRTVALNLEFLVPGPALAITEQVAAFLEHRNVVGGIGIVSLLFFSAMAFSILESAMANIFHHRAPKRRHPLLSAVIPYQVQDRLRGMPGVVRMAKFLLSAGEVMVGKVGANLKGIDLEQGADDLKRALIEGQSRILRARRPCSR